MSKQLDEQLDKPKALSLRNAQGEKLVLDDTPADDGTETVIASDEQGNSLTLLEEYSLRKDKVGFGEFSITLLSAAASLAFAALIYIKIL